MRLFGLIGYPLTHSFSKKYFDEKFIREAHNDCLFENFPLATIHELPHLLEIHPNLHGFAVTIPHKKHVVQYLDESDDAVKATGACNCVVRRNGKMLGYNTDIAGFEFSFSKRLGPNHHRALVLGTGGGAEAVAFVLRKKGIPFEFVSRRRSKDARFSYDDLDAAVMQEHPVIINCTPLGTYPDVEGSPPIPYQYLSSDHYLFDLVYNPEKTRFLREGEERGAITCNGYEMLVGQAEENWKIWNQ